MQCSVKAGYCMGKKAYLPACSAATLNSATPTKAIVGAIAMGPMNRRSTPISPVKPIPIWNNAEIIIAP